MDDDNDKTDDGPLLCYVYALMLNAWQRYLAVCLGHARNTQSGFANIPCLLISLGGCLVPVQSLFYNELKGSSRMTVFFSTMESSFFSTM